MIFSSEVGSTLRLDSLQLEMFIVFIFVLLLGLASAQCPEWSIISWTDGNKVSSTANIVRAVGPNNTLNGAIDSLTVVGTFLVNATSHSTSPTC